MNCLPVEIKPLPAENDYSQTHSFLVHADVNRTLWITVGKGLKSFGGYLLSAKYQQSLVVPEYPKELHIMGEGSLLTLSGEKKIALMVRDIPGVKIELARVLPKQLQHLVSQSEGNFGKPDFKDHFGTDNLSERFEIKVPLPALEHGKAHYQPLDLSRYLIDQNGQNKRGIFFVKASDYQPPQRPAKATANENTEPADDSKVEDKRLILVIVCFLIFRTLGGSQIGRLYDSRNCQTL